MRKVLEVNVDDQNSGGVFSIVKNVIENNQSDIKIDIAAIEKFENRGNIDHLKKYNCDVFYIGYEGSKWKKQIKVYKNLRQFLRINRYETVHIHADTANKLLISGLASKHENVKNIIFHSHSSGVEGNGKTKTIIHRLCSFLLKYVGTKYVACSQLAAKWMYPNVNDKNIIYVKNGIPLKNFIYSETIRNQWRASLGLKDEILLGHVGRLMAPKNHEFLIELVKFMLERKKNVKLLIIGEGYKEKTLKKMVSDLSLEDNVIFFGTSNKVNELLMAMDVFCLPSFFEGLPIVGIEAQATGLPVIYSNYITREAKILDAVAYQPIGKENVKVWSDCILKFASAYNRDSDSNVLVKKAGFDISDMVKAFIDLYA